MRFALVFGFILSLVILTLTFTSAPAAAAGYSCLSVDRDMQIVTIFGDAASGASVGGQAEHLLFIDPTLSKRTQAVAAFSINLGHLDTQAIPEGERFVVTLDTPLEHPGKRLGGTQIGLLATVALDVQTISHRLKAEGELLPMTEGATFAAEVSYVKRTGEILKQDFDCALFLGEQAPMIDTSSN